MILSMTGFGKSDLELGQKKITIEIRALNSKQLDVILKLPSLLKDKESELRNELSKALIRGKIDVYVSFDGMEDERGVTINRSIFRDYYNQIKTLCEENGIPLNPDVVNSILRLPDTMKMEKAMVNEDEWNQILNGFIKAVNDVRQFRIQEGACLKDDMLKRLSGIESLTEAIEPFEKTRLEKISTRIRENLEELVGYDKIDKNRFEQELVYFIEKFDINEEKVRLKNHCKYFRDTIENEDFAGRKLGFIAQELGREINTIGSKANDSTIQQMVVQMKDELEKIKEQVNNIL
jgi:uncharacterized protein (TIGR00255 family)